MKIMPVQKQTTAGQRTRFRAFVIVGDNDGHVGLGVKAAKEVATAIRGAIINAKVNVVPVMRGYWGNKIGNPHTIPCKVSGKCGSVRVRLIPAPRGTGLVAGKIPKKVLGYAGIEDCFTASRGSTSTGGNFVKAVFNAIKATYAYNMPTLVARRPRSRSSPTTSRPPRSRPPSSRRSSKRSRLYAHPALCHCAPTTPSQQPM